MKKTNRILCKHCCVFFLLLLIGAACISESAAAPIKASSTAADMPKAVPDIKSTVMSPAAATVKSAPGTKININTADKAALEKIPEIGPVKAQAIIDGRPYKAVEDVMRVKGIKGKVFEVIKDYITVK